MGQEIARDVDEMEQEAPMRRAEAHVNKIVRKLCVFCFLLVER